MAMANQQVKVQLGDYGFKLTAVPDEVRFGLKEQMNVHKLIGGARVVDMIGDDPDAFSWSGTWLGSDATDNADGLYSYMQEKKLLSLTFGQVNRHVVISELDLVYKRQYMIDYKITCVVVEQVGTTGFADGNNAGAGFNVDQAAAGDAQTDDANNAQINTPNDAGNNLGNGADGQAQVLEAGGVNTANVIG